MPINNPSLTLQPGEIQSIAATGTHRYIVSNDPYYYGFGASEPTTWSLFRPTPDNNGFNVPDFMGTMWIWNAGTSTLSINIHRGA